jgi:hypothetical protein
MTTYIVSIWYADGNKEKCRVQATSSAEAEQLALILAGPEATRAQAQ